MFIAKFITILLILVIIKRKIIETLINRYNLKHNVEIDKNKIGFNDTMEAFKEFKRYIEYYYHVIVKNNNDSNIKKNTATITVPIISINLI